MAQTLRAQSAAVQGNAGRDRRLVLWLVGAVVLVAFAYSAYRPQQDDNDPRPTTFNTGSRGTKAAFLLLPELGYATERWREPTADLRGADAASTTLILTEPILPVKGLQPLQAEVAAFLKRGGRVLATGMNGAEILPGGRAEASKRMYKQLCETTPEGAGPLAAAGKISLATPVRWAADGPEFKVDQRCGDEAVVVRFRYGAGEAVWWSSPMPMSNAGLSDDAGLRLLLASVGPAQGRRVLFDEYLHESRESIRDTLSGLPWWWMSLQAALVALLLVLSRGRRNGPVRTPVVLPRTSPIEFAESMGRLYARAGATQAATEAARSRLLSFLAERCGISRELLRSGGVGIAEALADRMGGDWAEVEDHLQQARESAVTGLPGKVALRLVVLLDADHEKLQKHMQFHRPVVSRER